MFIFQSIFRPPLASQIQNFKIPFNFAFSFLKFFFPHSIPDGCADQREG
jgi:hypothetical protein